MSDDWPQAIADGWHPVALAAAVKRRPLATALMDVPLVVFRGAGGALAVLRDRCPHRGMPLSRGRVQDGTLVCPYHGWRFEPGGACVAVPGACSVPAVRASVLPAVERAGLVWTSLAPEPPPFPALPPAMEDAALDRFWWSVAPAEARVLDVLENHLDPAHPHYLHPWIVRSPTKRRPVQVTVRVHERGAEAIYEEDARASALMPRLLEGHRLRGIGRLHPPCIGEILFEGDAGLKLSIAVVFTPEGRQRTRPYAHFATARGVAPAWAKRWVLKAFHLPVIRQDRRALHWQAEGLAAGPMPYAMGPLDYLGPAIWSFANGIVPPAADYRTEAYF